MSKLPVSNQAYARLFICTKHLKRCGPVGSRYGNPSVGWVVMGRADPAACPSYVEVSPVLGSLREAKIWAEERYDVRGWDESRRSGPYHHVYAIGDDSRE